MRFGRVALVGPATAAALATGTSAREAPGPAEHGDEGRTPAAAPEPVAFAAPGVRATLAARPANELVPAEDEANAPSEGEVARSDPGPGGPAPAPAPSGPPHAGGACRRRRRRRRCPRGS